MLKISENKTFNPLLKEIKQVSHLLRLNGLAEAKSGNFSLNISEMCKSINITFSESELYFLNKKYRHLANQFILISSSGSRMRDIEVNPESYLNLLYINSTGNEYYNILLDNNRKIPSSELFTHLEVQNLLSKINAKEKAILHTHPAEVIALTHLKNFNSEKKINKMLNAIQPEVAILFPEGIGYVPYRLTGSEKLAVETKEKFDKHKIVIWEKHGCLTIGKDFNEAFDHTEILIKTLKIFILCLSTGNKPEGLNVKQIKELRKLNKK